MRRKRNKGDRGLIENGVILFVLESHTLKLKVVKKIISQSRLIKNLVFPVDLKKVIYTLRKKEVESTKCLTHPRFPHNSRLGRPSRANRGGGGGIHRLAIIGSGVINGSTHSTERPANQASRCFSGWGGGWKRKLLVN